MGTIKIGSSSNRAGVTIEPSTVLFNGNNVKYIKSGLIEIWSNIKALVPTMTSNTAPSGTASASSSNSADKFQPYRAFDNDSTTKWLTSGTSSISNQWLRYEFTNPVIVKSFSLEWAGYMSTVKYEIQASNDNSTWDKLTESISSVSNVDKYELNNDKAYKYFRLYIYNQTMKSSEYSCGDVISLQFYGTRLVGLVPILTSNIGSDGGEVIYSSEYNNGPAYKAFNQTNNDDYDAWMASGNCSYPQYLGYSFTKPKCVKAVLLANRNSNTTCAIKTFTIQGSNDSDFGDIEFESEVLTNPSYAKAYENIYTINNNKKCLYWRISALSYYTENMGGGNNVSISKLQFYG